VNEFLQEVSRAGAWINQNPEAAADLLARHEGLNRDAIAAALHRRKYGARPLDASLVGAQQAMADTLLRAHRIPRRVLVHDAQWTPGPGSAAAETATAGARC